jgi:hypothetical protein
VVLFTISEVRVFFFASFFWTFLKKKVVGMERSPLSLVSATEELLDRIVAAPV